MELPKSFTHSVPARLKNLHNLFVVLFACVFIVQAGYLVFSQSITEPEKNDLVNGCLYLNGANSLAPFRLPAVRALLALPAMSALRRATGLDAGAIVSCRLVNLCFSLLLATFVYWFSRRDFGPAAALAALFIFIFSPTVVAYSALATTAMACSLLFFCTIRLAVACRDKDKLFPTAALGLLLGFSCASGTVCLFLCALVPLLLLPDSHETRDLSRYAGKVAIVGLFALAALWVIYGAPNSFSPEKAFQAFEQAIRHALTGMANSREVYLLKADVNTWAWFYHPVIVLAKNPAALSALLAGCLLFFVLGPDPAGELSFAYWLSVAGILLGAGIFRSSTPAAAVYLSLAPFICSLVGVFCARAVECGFGATVRGVIVAACLLIAVEAVGAFPFSFSFVSWPARMLCSEIFTLSGPDIDTGQDDGRVLAVLQELRGADNKSPVYVNPMPAKAPLTGYVALNATTYHENRDDYEWLKYFPIVKRIGGSWVIFRVERSRMIELARHVDPASGWRLQQMFLSFLWWRAHLPELIAVSSKLARYLLRARYFRGRAYFVLGKIREARRDFHFLLGHFGKHGGSMERWLQATEFLLDDSGVPAARRRALCAAWLFGLSPLQTAVVRQALIAELPGLNEVTPGHPWSEYRLVRALQLCGERKYGQALPLLKSVQDITRFRWLVHPRMKEAISCQLSSQADTPEKQAVFAYKIEEYWPDEGARRARLLVEQHPDCVVAWSVWLRYVARRRTGGYVFSTGGGSLWDFLEGSECRLRTNGNGK